MMSLVVGFSFFLSFLQSKRRKKKREKEELKKSSREKEAKNQFTKGVLLCVKYERIDEFKLSSFF